MKKKVGFFQKLKKLFEKKLPQIDLDERFSIIAEAGHGSMAKVFRARDLLSGRECALKILDKLKLAKLLEKEFAVKRPSEGEIASLLKHRNLTVTYDHGLSTKGEQWLAMEFIEGMPLSFLMETKSPKLKGKLIDIFGQFAAGLDAVHTLGYLHRDVCPRNLIVGNDGVVKLIDFGLSLPDSPEFNAAGNRKGTLAYMAPELLARRKTDRRLEVFAWGVCLYEALTCQHPWEAGDSYQLMVLHMNTAAKDPREYRPDLDDEVVKLVMKAIAKQPSDRFKTMRDAIQALDALPNKSY